MNTNILAQLRKPFAPATIQWRVGATNKDKTRGLALAYADTRQYQERLDNLFGLDWSVRYTPVSDKSVICALTLVVDGKPATRSATGHGEDLPSAEAQSFKRACSAFGLGRYLYGTPQRWETIQPQGKSYVFTATALNVLRRSLAPQTGRTAPEADNPFTDPTAGATAQQPDIAKLRRQFHAVGTKLFNGRWEEVRHKNIHRLTEGKTEHTNDLLADELQTLITGMHKLEVKQNGRVPA